MKKENIVLTADAVYAQMRLVSEALEGKRSNGDEFTYYRAVWTGCPTAFTVPEEVAKLFAAGEIYEVTLAPSSFEQSVLDEQGNETDEKITVENFIYAGHLSWEQKLNVEERKDKLLEIAERGEDRKTERALKLARVQAKLPASEEVAI